MSRLFRGFTPETFTFFLMIGMNNNKPFFDENRALYERHVKEPLYALTADLEPWMRAIDPALDTRPQRAVARIRRSTRYTRDKSPYRDHLWVSWRDRDKDEDAGRLFSFYFSISHSYMDCGAGYYMPKSADMREMRGRIANFPGEFEGIVTAPGMAGLTLLGEDYKRAPDLPAGIGEAGAAFYTKKSFYLEKNLPIDQRHTSPELVDILAETFAGIKPFYDFLQR